MAAKKKNASKSKKTEARATPARAASPKATRTRLQRSDEDKIRIVRQVMESGNQSAEIKKLGIYPNQFYDWKKKYSSSTSGAAAPQTRARRATAPGAAASTVAEEAKAFIHGKSALLDRLRAQRQELDHLISELEH
ncbi:MAG: Transposase [Myxococcaceae bacterium]|nr:Transposase [Myxococcaceae bacterium]